MELARRLRCSCHDCQGDLYCVVETIGALELNMKIARFGEKGNEKPALVDEDHQLRDLSGITDSIDAVQFDRGLLDELKSIDPDQLPRVEGHPRLGVPFSGISKYVAIGLNYREHARESGMSIPKEPVVFLKATSSIGGPDDDIVRPPGSRKLDWEVELGVVIGRVAKYVSEVDALKYVAGYCVLNDVSEREFQLERGGQWDKGKGCDTFGPVGPWLVTADEILDPQDLRLWLDVNGQRMQEAHTSDMIFGVAALVAYVSWFMTLMPGDIIATGTPSGVGGGRKPPVYLNPGDKVRLGIDGLGTQMQHVVRG